MIIQKLFAPKSSNTYADALTAFGLADLFDKLLAKRYGDESVRQIRIVDTGSYYEIQSGTTLSTQDLDEIPFFRNPARFLTDKQIPQPPPDTSDRNIDQVWEQVRTYNEQRKLAFTDGLRGTELEQQLKDLQPAHDTQLVIFISDWKVQKAKEIYNRHISKWAQTRPHFNQHLQAILSLYTKVDSDRVEILKNWGELAQKDGIKTTDTASQMLCPHQGKGANESKANALRMDNIKNRPWPEEVIKAMGLWHGLAPRKTSDNQDWKAYIIAPRNISFAALHEIYPRFTRHLSQERHDDVTSLKTDITSILLFYQTWLEYIETLSQIDDDFDAESANPQNVVSGFYVGQFKLLSPNAYTLINQTFLGLPGWGCAIHTRADVGLTREMIKEHLVIVRNIEENHSDGYDLLRRYRDFVAGENWQAFFDFAAGYAHEILVRMNADECAPKFSTIHLRRLFMSNQKLTPILENPGFQSVAEAIRQSTIVPQWKKAQKKHGKSPDMEQLYDIRYGLAAELKRKSTQKDAFIKTLMDFVQAYNQETSQVYENTGKRQRDAVPANAVASLAGLVDQYNDVELIANLLIAYGYAWNSETKDQTK